MFTFQLRHTTGCLGALDLHRDTGFWAGRQPADTDTRMPSTGPAGVLVPKRG